MKLWAGRFQKETDTLVNDFNSSIGFDARLYKQDIQGSMAHAAMLGRQGIIEEHEAEKIINGLKTILSDIEGGWCGVLPGQRGHPHEHRSHAHPAHRRRGQASPHRPQPK